MSITYEELSKYPIHDRPAILYAAFAEILPRQPELFSSNVNAAPGLAKALEDLLEDMPLVYTSYGTERGRPSVETFEAAQKALKLWEQ